MNTLRRLFFASCFVWVLASPTLLVGQITTATISGTVTDESGAVLPGVSITARDVDTGAVRSVVSDDSGRYRLPLLEPGTYEVQGELTGFQTTVMAGITLEVGGSAVIDLKLRVGAISDKVVVQGEAPLVETTSTTMAGLVDDKKIRDLPLNGRSFEQLAVLQPGVTVSRFSGGEGTKISVGGGRTSANNFLLDGVNVNNASDGSGSAAGNNLGVESIREFKVLTSTYAAAYGRNSGAVINVVTKSGTNVWHGSVFEFLRNSALDAKNFFDALDKSIPPFKRNQFGFTLGGPIRKDKTFIFGNYEGVRERLGLSYVAIVPSGTARLGIVPDPTRPGQNRNVVVADAIKPYLGLYPVPNGRDFLDGTGEYLSSPTKRTNEDYFVVRFDHQFSSADSFSARYSHDKASVLTPDSLGFLASDSHSRSQSAVLEERRIFSSTFINTARFGYSRTFSEAFADPITGSAPPSFIPGRRIGQIRIGASTQGASPVAILGSNPPTLSPYTTFQYSDDVNWTRGSHGVQAGAMIMRIQNNSVTFGTGHLSQYIFNTLEEFLTARPARFAADTPASNRRRGWRQTYYGFYIQDDIRASRTLTLNVGLRWEFVPEIHEVNGLQSQLVKLTDPLYTVGLPLFNPTGHQLQPRIGIAWDPFGDGKTSIRAGFGIFHDQLIGAYYGSLFGSNLSPYVKSASVQAPIVVPFPDAYRLINDTALQTGVRLDPNPHVPTKYHYNLNIQREIMRDTVVTAAYVGSHGVHLPRTGDGNSAIPTIRADGKKFWPTGALSRFNPAFALILNSITDANSFYNSLQLSVNRRFHQNFQYQVSYTYGRSVDDGSNQLGSEQNAPQNQTQMDNRIADRGLSTFDTRHNLTGNLTVDLPFGPNHRLGGSTSGVAAALLGGWQLSTILGIATGLPQTALVGFNNSRNQDTIVPERPDLAPGRSNSPILGGPDRYFDPLAFALQEPGTLGNLGRTTIITPGFVNFDFSLVKALPFGEERRVEFRSEFFNIFNRPNFGPPAASLFTSATVRNGSAGRISRTVNTSRQIQFGLKILF